MVEANKGKRDVEREIKFERVKVEERKENIKDRGGEMDVVRRRGIPNCKMIAGIK